MPRMCRCRLIGTRGKVTLHRGEMVATQSTLGKPGFRPLLDSNPPPVRMAQAAGKTGLVQLGSRTTMKCQKCSKAATLHITEVISEEQFEELHLCEECAQKYLYEPQQNKMPTPKSGEAGQLVESDEPGLMNRESSMCGIKFVEFINTG